MMSSPAQCAVCNDVIGVYEPLFVIQAGSARRTSLAREPQLGGGDVAVVHDACGSRLGLGQADDSA